MNKDRSLSVCPKVEEGRHRLPVPPGREGNLSEALSLAAPGLTTHWEGSLSHALFICGDMGMMVAPILPTARGLSCIM